MRKDEEGATPAAGRDPRRAVGFGGDLGEGGQPYGRSMRPVALPRHGERRCFRFRKPERQPAGPLLDQCRAPPISRPFRVRAPLSPAPLTRLPAAFSLPSSSAPILVLHHSPPFLSSPPSSVPRGHLRTPRRCTRDFKSSSRVLPSSDITRGWRISAGTPRRACGYIRIPPTSQRLSCTARRRSNRSLPPTGPNSLKHTPMLGVTRKCRATKRD